MVKFAVEFWWKMLLTIFPSKRSSKISFQTQMTLCLCETKVQGGGIALFWGRSIPYKVSRDMGYGSDSIAISRDMGPLSIRGVSLNHSLLRSLILSTSPPWFCVLFESFVSGKCGTRRQRYHFNVAGSSPTDQ